jgi:hypothetical protein
MSQDPLADAYLAASEVVRIHEEGQEARIREIVREEVAAILAGSMKASRCQDVPKHSEALGGSGDPKKCQWHPVGCSGRKRNGGPC